MEIETGMYEYNNIDNNTGNETGNNMDSDFDNDNMIAWNLFMMTGDPDDYMRYRRIKGSDDDMRATEMTVG